MNRILLAGLISVTLHAQSSSEIEGILTKIATFQYGADPAALVQLDEMMSHLSGSAEKRRMAEGLLLKFIQSNATPAAKEYVYRELSLVGSNASIPVLSPLLTRIDSAEMARFALAAIPGPAVDEALRKAFTAAQTDRIRIGLMNSLGRRKDTRAVPLIAPFISNANQEVVAAAVAALASIGDRPALDALAAARKSAAAPARLLVSEAYLVCADRIAERGDKATAVKVYQEMIAPAEPVPIRTRALKSFAAADPKAATAALVSEVKSGNLERQVIAIRLTHEIPGPDVTKALVGEMPKLRAVAQVHVLTAVAFRSDTAAKPAVLAALKSNERAVRAAALAALGKIGDASNVQMLAEAAAAGEEPEAAAARQSLYTMRGQAVDSAIVSAMNSTSGKVKAELILAAGERAAASASDALIRASQESDPDVRREALRAIRNVGGAAQVPALLDTLLKSSSAIDRRDATQTLGTVLRRAQPSPVTAVISAYNNAASREVKVSLLEVLGQTSNADALPTLREGMKNSDPEIVRGAILALTAWDNATPLPDLLNLARTAPAPTAAEAAAPPIAPGAGGGARAGGGGGRGGGGGGGRGFAAPTNNVRVLALRGVLRLMVLQSQRTASESGKLLSEVMSLSTLLPEKRSVLSLLPYFPSKESLAVAQAAVADPAIANEAKVALDQVSEGMKTK
jgi:HEAT repeat protein